MINWSLSPVSGSETLIQDAILFLLCLAAIGLLVIAVTVGLIIASVLKGRGRAIALDVVLAGSVVFLIVAESVNDLITFPASLMGKSQATMDFITSGADLQTIPLLGAHCTTGKFSQIMLEAEGISYSDSLKAAEQSVLEMYKRSPWSDGLILRLAILHQAAGSDPEEAFSRCEKQSNKRLSPWLRHIRQFYSNRLDARYTQIVAQWITKDICNSIWLPPGWYSDQLLQAVYERTDKLALERLVQRRDTVCRGLSERFEWLASFEILTCILSVVFLIVWRRKILVRTDGEPCSYGVRPALGGLPIFQSIMGLGNFVFFLIVAGLNFFTHSSVISPKLIEPLMELVGRFFGVIGVLWATHLFILSRGGAGLADLLKDERRYTARKMALGLVIAFALFNCVHLVAMIVTHLVFQIEPTSGRAGLQAVDAFRHGNYLAFSCLLSSMCLTAIPEEIVFRRLLYPWLRHRWGVPAAIILTSIIFAIAHLNFTSVIFYFAAGVLLAAIYERTRSLFLVCVLHCLWNCWSVMVSILLTPGLA